MTDHVVTCVFQYVMKRLVSEIFINKYSLVFCPTEKLILQTERKEAGRGQF